MQVNTETRNLTNGSNCGFLLTATMDGSQTMHHCHAFNANNTSRWKAVPNHVEGSPVIGMTEDRNDHCRVSDVKICVTRGIPCVAVTDVAGHGQLHDIQAKTL
jgi:hypothetical protein